MRQDPAARWFAKVNKDGPEPVQAPWLGPCWLWTASVLPGGYGEFRVGPGVKVVAHRWIAQQVAGRQLRPDEPVDHLCHDPAFCTPGVCVHRRCVNPAHLRVTTTAANVARSGAITAINASRVRCVHGHPFTPDNTYRHPKRGTRHCRACAIRRANERLARLGR